MTIAVDLGHKARKQTNKQTNIKESATIHTGISVPLFVHFSSFPVNFSIISAHEASINTKVLESSNFVYMLRTIKCNAVSKTKVVRIIFAFFFYNNFLPFSISLQCNDYGCFCQRFLS